MHGWLILCDFAEVLNGKLYIQGGGWSRFTRGADRMNVYLASKVLVPWVDTNQRFPLSLKLVSDDGAPVVIDNHPVEIQGEFEVGRPPGLAHGTEMDVPLAFHFEGLPLPYGRYRWELQIGDSSIADVAFDVIAPS